jgi:hypothetical protein
MTAKLGCGATSNSGVVALGSKAVSESSGSEWLDAVVDLGGGPAELDVQRFGQKKGAQGKRAG